MGLRKTRIGRFIERGFWSLQSAIWDQPIKGGVHHTRVEALLSWVGSGLQRRSRILDLGCATGEIAVRLAGLGHEVCALDLSPRMLELARRRPGSEAVRFMEADLAMGLPESLGTFDAVLLLGLLQCVPDPQRVVREAATHLAPGGVLFVEVKRSPEREVVPSSAGGLSGRGLRAMKARASRSTWIHRFDITTVISMLTAADLAAEVANAPAPWLRLIGLSSNPDA